MRAALAVFAALAFVPTIAEAQPNANSNSLDTLRRKVAANDVRANTLELEYIELLTAAHNDDAGVDGERLQRHLVGLREVAAEYLVLEKQLRDFGKDSAANTAANQAELFSSRAFEFEKSLAHGQELRKQRRTEQERPKGAEPGHFSDDELRGPLFSGGLRFIVILLGIGLLASIVSYFVLRREKKKKREEEERKRQEEVRRRAEELEQNG